MAAETYTMLDSAARRLGVSNQKAARLAKREGWKTRKIYGRRAILVDDLERYITRQP